MKCKSHLQQTTSLKCLTVFYLMFFVGQAKMKVFEIKFLKCNDDKRKFFFFLHKAKKLALLSVMNMNCFLVQSRFVLER